MDMANPLLESFREPPRICVTNSSRSQTDLTGKGNPDLLCIGLFKLLAFYCDSQFVF